MAKKKLNVKFLALVLGLLTIGGAVIGGFVLVQYRNDPVKHIRRGDQLLADGRPEDAVKQYGRGIGKAPFEMPYYDKTIIALQTIVPESESKSKEMFNQLVMLEAAKAENASGNSETGQTAKEIRDETLLSILDRVQVYTFQVPPDDLQAKENAYGAAARILESVNQSLIPLGPDEVEPLLKAAVRGVVVEPEWRTASGLDQQQWEESIENIEAAIEIDPQYVPIQYGLLRGTLDRFADQLVTTGRTSLSKALKTEVDPRFEAARAALRGELSPEVSLAEFERSYLLYLAGFAGDTEQDLTPRPDPKSLVSIQEEIAKLYEKGKSGGLPRFELNARLCEIRLMLLQMISYRPTSTVDTELRSEITDEVDNAFVLVSEAIYDFDPENLRNCVLQLPLVRIQPDPIEMIDSMIALARTKKTVSADRLLRESLIRTLQRQAFDIALQESKGQFEITADQLAALEEARQAVSESYSEETVRDRDVTWQRLEVLYNYRLALVAISEDDSTTANAFARKANRATQLLDSILEEQNVAPDFAMLESAIGAAKIIGDFGTATQMFERALARNPVFLEEPAALIELARLYNDSGRTNDAAGLVEKIRLLGEKKTLDAEVIAKIATIESAIASTEQGVTLADLNGASLLVDDQKALAAGNTVERRRILTEAIETPGIHRAVRLQAMLRFAALEQAEGQIDLSQQFARQALEIDPDSMQAKMILAFEEGSTPVDRARTQAAMVYENVQDIDVATAKNLQTSLREFRGRYSPEQVIEMKTAIAEIEADILASEERRLPAVEFLLLIALRNQNFDEAKILIDSMEEMLGGEGPDTIRLRAAVMAGQGDLDDAITLLASSIDDRGFGGDRMCLLLGDYLNRRGDREAALARFDQAFKQAPARSANAFALGEALLRAGKLNDALQVFRAARGTGRNSPNYRDLWLGVERQAGNFDVAIRERRRLYEIDPLDVNNSVALVQLLMEAPIGRLAVVNPTSGPDGDFVANSPRYSEAGWDQLTRAERQKLQIEVRSKRRKDSRDILNDLVEIIPSNATVVVGAHRFGVQNPELKLDGDVLEDSQSRIRELIAKEPNEITRRRLEQSLSLIVAEAGMNKFRASRTALGADEREKIKQEADALFIEATRLEGPALSDSEAVIANFLIQQNDLTRAAVYQQRLLTELETAEEAVGNRRQVAAQLIRIELENERLEEAEAVLDRYFKAADLATGGSTLFGSLEFAKAEAQRKADGGRDGGALSSASLDLLKKSEAHFADALTADAGNSEAIQQLARIARYRWKYAEEDEREERFEIAVQAVEKLVALNKSVWATRKMLVDLYEAGGDIEAALLELRTLLDIAPQLSEPRIRLVVLLERAGLIEQARDVAQVALDRDPSNVLWARNVGALRTQLKEWDEAAQLFGRLYEQTENITFLRSQVDALMSREEPAAAQVVSLARQNQREFSRDPMLIGGYCAALAATGRRSAALQQFEAAYRSTRDRDNAAKNGLARWLTNMYPKTEDGIEELTAFVDRISDGNPELLDLMQIYTTWNSFEGEPEVALSRAVDVVERAITVGGANDDPGLLAAYMQLGVLKARQNDCPGATRAFEQVLELRPDDAQILNNLAYLAVDCGTDLKLARARAELAVAARPASSEFRDTLGVILLAQAKEIADSDPEARDLAVRKAEQELKQSTRLSQNVSPWLHLSELYLFQNRLDEARRAVAKASDLDEDGRFQDKFDALLEEIKDR